MVFIFCAQARWATYDEAPFEITDRTQIDTIHKDGTWEQEITEELKVLNEAGRDRISTRRLFYNESTETLSIKEAYTLKDGQKYGVAPTDIQDKPLASSQKGFDQIRQVLIAYPHVSIGATIFIKYKIETKKTPVPNHWSGVLWWGIDYSKKSKNIIYSKIPLKIKINDPTKALSVKEKQEKGRQVIEITQTKPLYFDTVNDGPWSWIPHKKLTWGSFSSFKSWEELGDHFSAGWEKALSAPLPARFQTIAEKASKKKTEVDQINSVTSDLMEMIQYVGDWRTVEGLFWPRPLETIDATHFGDCKDFSASTIAILRKLGFQAYAVFVTRGTERRDLEEALPFLRPNHAMVKVVAKSGAVYWVDPTNLVSMAQGIFPDVAGRKALVVTKEGGGLYESIPPVNYVTNSTISEKRLRINKDASLDVWGTVTTKGEASLDWAGKALSASPQALEEELIFGSAGEYLDKKNRRSVILPNLKSRVVEDLVFKYDYNHPHQVKKTNQGYYLALTSPLSIKPGVDQVADMYMGPPASFKRTLIIENGKIEDAERLNYTLSTPWVDITRTFQKDKDALKMEESFQIKTSFIPVDELQGEVFKKLKEASILHLETGLVVDLGA
ncbi:MAG: DUF3857 domain-containing protein [Alphaproteobacteria bacterium]